MTRIHDSELRYIAHLIFYEGLDAVPFIEKHRPLIVENIRGVSHMQIQLRRASRFLHENPPTTQGLGVASYLSFAALVFKEIRRYGFSSALPYIQADKVQFLSWGFDSTLLSRLALLQGISI